MGLIFVDTEADGPCPGMGHLTEFGAVDFQTSETFHGVLWESVPDPTNPAKSIITGAQYDAGKVFANFDEWIKKITKSGRPIMVNDNPAYDFQWINHGFHTNIGYNPFGHSARRIGDFYAGLRGNFYCRQDWKKLRITPHDHNPIHDCRGNIEAFKRLLNGER